MLVKRVNLSAAPQKRPRERVCLLRACRWGIGAASVGVGCADIVDDVLGLMRDALTPHTIVDAVFLPVQVDRAAHVDAELVGGRNGLEHQCLALCAVRARVELVPIKLKFVRARLRVVRDVRLTLVLAENELVVCEVFGVQCACTQLLDVAPALALSMHAIEPARLAFRDAGNVAERQVHDGPNGFDHRRIERLADVSVGTFRHYKEIKLNDGALVEYP